MTVSDLLFTFSLLYVCSPFVTCAATAKQTPIQTQKTAPPWRRMKKTERAKTVPSRKQKV